MITSSKLLTQTAFAKSVGVGQSWISKLVKAGKLPTIGGMIDPVKAVPIMAKLKRQPSPHKEELRYQNARLAQARADAQEIKNKVTRGELLDGRVVADVWGNRLSNFRNKVLALHNKVAPMLAGVTDPEEAKAILDCELEEALAELGTPDEVLTGVMARTDDARQKRSRARR
jgi:hypothetical protein